MKVKRDHLEGRSASFTTHARYNAGARSRERSAAVDACPRSPAQSRQAPPDGKRTTATAMTRVVRSLLSCGEATSPVSGVEALADSPKITHLDG
jgi:hypothetical protein